MPGFSDPTVPLTDLEVERLDNSLPENLLIQPGARIQRLENLGGGFIDYNDASTASVPINLSAEVWTDLPNDGLGAFTTTAYAPPGVTSLMDNSTGYVDPTQLKLGDTILLRNDYTINPHINNAALSFRYVLGTGAGEYTLSNVSRRLDLGSGIDYRIASGVDLIYMGDTNTRDNPIKLQVKLSSTGTLTVAGSVIQVIQGGGSQ